MEKLFITDEFRRALPDTDIFEHAMQLQGESVRKVEGRHTFRTTIDSKPYFVKQHAGVGYRELVKELLTLKIPIVSARNEYQAINYLRKHGLATMSVAAFGERGRNPATMSSFVITHEISNTYTMEEVTGRWAEEKPAFEVKLKIITKLAAIARRMHELGMNHRDFYLCHFRIDKQQLAALQEVDPEFFLMDLHRAQIRKLVPLRWRVKDIAALYFSAAHLPITTRDIYRFVRLYTGKSLRQTFREDARFWRKVQRRAEKFYRRHWSEGMPKRPLIQRN